MRYIAWLLLLPAALFSMPEEELFFSKSSPATIWYTKDQQLVVFFGTNLIVIDAWHYPEIDD